MPVAELFEYPDWENVSMFDSDDLLDDGIFVLLVHGAEASADKVFVWVGKESEAADAQRVGGDFAAAKGLAPDVPITVVQQDAEDSSFWSYFVDG